MKKINKLLLIVVGVFIVLSFNVMKVNALDYSKTYEQAFPDKEFRRLILICVNYNICDYSTDNYLASNWGLHYLVKHNISGNYVNQNQTVNIPINESLIESKKTEVLNKAQLDRITYLINSTGGNPQNIKSLKGIEYLTNLKQLAFEKIGTKEVDLSQNKNLVHVALTSSFSNYFHSYQGSPSGELDVATLEKVNTKGLPKIEGLMLTLNKNKRNTLDLYDLETLKELIVNDSNLVDIKLEPKAEFTKLELNMNSLQNITIPDNTNIDNANMFFQKFKMTIKVNSEQEIPFKLSLNFPTTVEHNGNIHKFHIDPDNNPVTSDTNGNYEFKSLNLGNNVYKINMIVPSDNTKYNGVVEINIEKDKSLPRIPTPGNNNNNNGNHQINNNINKNPKTGIKTFTIIIFLIVISSCLIYKYKLKKKTYM